MESLTGSFRGFLKLCRTLGAAILWIIWKGCPKLPGFLFQVMAQLFRSISRLSTKVALYVPRGLAPSVRYGSRYWQRSRQKQTIPPTHELRLWRVDWLTGGSGSSRMPNIETADSDVPFLHLLSSKDGEKVLFEIIKLLHYTDVVNLSLTSKKLRTELFGSSSRVQALRIASCVPAKSGCYSCNMQICEVRIGPGMLFDG